MIQSIDGEVNIHKDDRSRRGNDGYKKRNNAKEAFHRHEQQEKRIVDVDIPDQQVSQEINTKGKYQNGKPKKQIKEQQFWVDEPQNDVKNAKKKKKQKYMKTFCNSH